MENNTKSAPEAIMKKKRLAMNMTQAQLAEKCQTSISAIRRWESGVARPRAHNAVKIAEALKCSIEDIYPEWDTLSPLARAIARKGYDTKSFSKAVGIDRKSADRIKRGTTKYSIEMANRISAFLNTSPESLQLCGLQHTPNLEWQSQNLKDEQINERNLLLAKYTYLIDCVIFDMKGYLKWSGLNKEDARQELQLRLCCALGKLIADNRCPDKADAYLRKHLKCQLKGLCINEFRHGIKDVPSNVPFCVLPLDAIPYTKTENGI